MDRPAMTEPVVVIGPAAVCGPGVVEATLASVALEAIDDRLTVLADRVVAVRELWCDVMHAALAGERGAAVLVVPSWWPRSRVELVEDAMLESCAHVTVLLRGCSARSEASDVVELGPDCVVVHAATGERFVLPRVGRAEWVADNVLATLSTTTSVVIDIPDGVPESPLLAAELARRLRKRGIAVTSLDDDGVRRAVLASRRAELGGPGSNPRPVRARKPRVAVLVGALAVIAALAGAALNPGSHPPEADDVTWVVEGRVAAELPADWMVERVASGPGSARVQVLSPNDPHDAIHITQARVRVEETLQQTAEALKSALDEQPRGLFADFDPDARSAGRPAVTYRERRAAVEVDWVVVLDRGVRIAVGCQHAVDQPDPDPACERAVRTAHVVP
jgi:type VII secretion-associated protein (TIGR03931 family)